MGHPLGEWIPLHPYSTRPRINPCDEPENKIMEQWLKLRTSATRPTTQPLDNDHKRAHKLFVGGLAKDTTDDKLDSHFSRFGELTDFVVMKCPDTRRSRGFGFITFATKDQLEDCMQAAPHTLDGKTVELKRARPREDNRSGGGGRNNVSVKRGGKRGSKKRKRKAATERSLDSDEINELLVK